jgi:hypothetical protein
MPGESALHQRQQMLQQLCSRGMELVRTTFAAQAAMFGNILIPAAGYLRRTYAALHVATSVWSHLVKLGYLWRTYAALAGSV